MKGCFRRMLTACLGLAVTLVLIPAAQAEYSKQEVSFPFIGERYDAFKVGWEEEGKAQLAGNLVGTLVLPDGPGPFPAMVFAHGCLHYEWSNVSDWARFFTDLGIAILFVDSHRPRGIETTCSGARPWGFRRSDDAHSALAYLSTHPKIRADRIAMMGQSYGGETTLAAMDANTMRARRFVAGIALYPGCKVFMTQPLKLDRPTIILTGSADTWTPAEDCAVFARKLDTPNLVTTIFRGAYHAFDQPIPIQNTPRGAIGLDTDARDAARDKIRALLQAALLQP